MLGALAGWRFGQPADPAFSVQAMISRVAVLGTPRWADPAFDELPDEHSLAVAYSHLPQVHHGLFPRQWHCLFCASATLQVDNCGESPLFRCEFHGLRCDQQSHSSAGIVSTRRAALPDPSFCCLG